MSLKVNKVIRVIKVFREGFLESLGEEIGSHLSLHCENALLLSPFVVREWGK